VDGNAAGEGDHRAHGEIDAAQEDDERHADGDDADEAGLAKEVVEVGGGEEDAAVRLDAEELDERGAEDEGDERGQRAEAFEGSGEAGGDGHGRDGTGNMAVKQCSKGNKTAEQQSSKSRQRHGLKRGMWPRSGDYLRRF